jgi:ABC-2 type transport system permease protein
MSPSSATVDIGLARYKHFLGLVDRFHQEWRDYFVPKVFARRSLTASDYEAFPAFQYEEESEAAVRRRVSAGGGIRGAPML